ncbi:PTS fructose transporter subunit IIA [Orenia metallireducens]|jgi:fructose-specific phosphotransferase system IIA component|uniref:PTS fructose transporter subunit IIA n=1 Tax=Orenia metallireducens TaxID=1413210 RepID=A0A1C0AD60_9FIRM|nr:PTS sugar transporter subunit IIA [Orenia metallireducens]OCL28564.1 PTS fructose transporter subunit IIA [Orenia metallireducens]
MKISNLMREDLIKLNLANNTKNEVLAEMVDLLDAADKITSKDEFYQTILAREAKSTTGVGNGIAIPHGKSDVVKEPTLVFAKSEQGVDFDSFDDQPVKILFMIAVPEGKNDEHLKVLAQLSRKLMHADFREALMNANTKEDILTVIKENE